MIDPLLAIAEHRPDALALVDASGRWTWRRLHADASGLAQRLRSAAGGRVALLARDTADTVVAIHAVRLAGATVAPLNRRLAQAELVPLLRGSGATVLLHDAAHADQASDLANSFPTLEPLALGAMSLPPRTISRRALDANAIGALMFTSGTTGMPRAAMLTHGNLLGSASAWNRFLDARPTDHWLAALPLSHVAGMGVVLRSACSGALLTVHDRFDPAAVRAALAADGVTHLSLVPTQLGRLLEGGPVTAPGLRALLLGGAPIPAELVRRAVAAGLPVMPTYGLTEAASGVTALAVDEVRDHPGSSGPALPGTLIRVIGDDGRDVSSGTVGGIEVSGPTVFAGYDRDPGATGAALHHGWLRTGDLGMLDEHGRLTVLDRRDDLIISGGENVSPVEVEAVLVLHPHVMDAAVVGRADARWGAVPVAAIAVRAGVTPDTASVTALARERLAGYKVPVAIEVVSTIPRTASGKIVRGDVRRLLAGAPTDVAIQRPDGARIHVRRRGQGPVVALLHATLSNAQELDALAIALADRLTVLAVDRRSAGASVMPPDDTLGPVDAPVHVNDLVAVLDAMTPGVTVLLAGHSYGGCVALELAARHPERIAGVWVFEPPYLAVLPDGASGSAALGERIATIARDDGLGPAALAFLETVNGAGIVRRLPATVLAQFEREGRGAVADSALAGFTPDRLGDITAPVVVGVGGRSHGPYESVATGLAARIPTLEVARFPTLAHGGPVSQSGLIADAILSFAERIGHAGPPEPGASPATPPLGPTPGGSP